MSLTDQFLSTAIRRILTRYSLLLASSRKERGSTYSFRQLSAQGALYPILHSGLILCMVSLTGCATAKAPILRVAPVAALPPTAPVPIGYAVIQSVHVKGPGGLEQGAIQLLEDNRLTPDLRQELWGKVIDPARAEERAKVFAPGTSRRRPACTQRSLPGPNTAGAS